MATLNQNLIDTVTAASRARINEETNNRKLIDTLFSDGVRPDDLVAPEKGADRTFFDGLKEAVVAGFPKNYQALIAANVKTLSEEQKDVRRIWMQKVNSIIGDWKNALMNRVKWEEAKAKSEAGEVEKKTPPETTKKKQLLAVLTWAQKVESTTIKDLPSFVKDLSSAIARIPD